MKYLIILIFVLGCATGSQEDIFGSSVGGEDTYQLIDPNGTYIVKREVKLRDGKLITRLRYFAKDGVTPLENTVAISRVGTLRSTKELAVLPEAFQYKVWFEKEEYFSQGKLNPRKRSMGITVSSPKPQWSGVKDFTLPKARYICFFSQLPDCLKIQRLLIKSARQAVNLYVIWDNFPYHKELYADVGDDLVTMASLKVSGQEKEEFKFSLDIGSQILFYHYDKNLNFTKMFWVAQGISMINIEGR